jgi:hypothetical protein
MMMTTIIIIRAKSRTFPQTNKVWVAFTIVIQKNC